MKIFVRVLIFVIALSVFSYFLLSSHFRLDYSGETMLSGLQADVEVLYDDYGVPHIYAKNATDAYAALGYVHAKDRLFQMDMMRRVGTGSLAELLGPDLVDIDKFFRTLGIPGHARSGAVFLQQYDTAIWYQAAKAYISGINKFIEEDNLPIEYNLLNSDTRPFTLEDVQAVAGYMSFTFAMALQTDPLVTKIAQEWGSEYLKVLSVHTLTGHIRIPLHYPGRDSSGQIAMPQLGIANVLDLMPVPPFLGSNAWVISGQHTASGKPVFCNDTHIGFAQPSVWYEAHMEYPGFSFYGNHLAGFPFALVGHSRSHSVGLTMFENDDFDLYLEQLNPDNRHEVKFGDSFEKIASRWDTIQVKGSEDIIFEIQSTRHGNIMNPVQKEIAALTDQPVAAWWVFLQEPSRALEATWGMAHATNIREVEQAVRLIHAPGLNVMYGDIDNNIAWWAAAKLPKRPAHVNSKLFLDGASGDDEIEGWYSFEENPMSINPPGGFVHSANNQPDTMSNGVLYPGYYYDGERSRRISEVISSRSDWTQESIKSLHLDTYTPQHVQNAHTMIEALHQEHRATYEGLLQQLKDWNGKHEGFQLAPTIYYKWLYHSMRLMMEDELGEDHFRQFLRTFMFDRSISNLLQTEDSPWWDKQHTEAKEERIDIVSEALELSVFELNKQLGNDYKAWKWEKAVSLEHEHPLSAQKPLNIIFNVKTSKVEGSAGAVNKLEFKLNGEGKYKVGSGPAMRIVIDFDQVEASESILPTGQSGNRFSPFYKDQTEMYVEGKYRPQLMNREQIEAVQSARFVLKPDR